MNPGRFMLVCLAGWLNREQQDVFEYLREEIRVLTARRERWLFRLIT